MFTYACIFIFFFCLVDKSCSTLCDPMDCSPPGSSVHGILQAWILEWVAMTSSRGSSQPRDWTLVFCAAGGFFIVEPPGKTLHIVWVSEWVSEVTKSCPTLCTPWTVAYQAPQFMEFSRWEYWSGLPFPPPWDLPDPGTEPRSPALQVDTLLSEPPGKASHCICISNYHNVHFKYLIILYINYA